jgi:hypothetical protein
LLTGLQPGGQAIVAVVAEQTAADGRHRDVRNMEIDEGVVRGALFRTPRSGRIARFLEGLVDVGDGDRQSPDRSIADQGLPIANFALCRVDGLRNRRRSRHLAALPAEPAAPDQLGGGSNDAVADHQDCHRCAADDIDLRRRRSPPRHASQVGADQLVDRLENALFGNAHQHDGFLVLDQL